MNVELASHHHHCTPHLLHLPHKQFPGCCPCFLSAVSHSEASVMFLKNTSQILPLECWKISSDSPSSFRIKANVVPMAPRPYLIKTPLPVWPWSWLQPHRPPCSSPRTSRVPPSQSPHRHCFLCLGSPFSPTQISAWLTLIAAPLCTLSDAFPGPPVLSLPFSLLPFFVSPEHLQFISHTSYFFIYFFVICLPYCTLSSLSAEAFVVFVQRS